MDTLFFFKERTGFIRKFYEDASSVFYDRIARIKGGEPPFDGVDGSAHEYDEPPFQDEWAGARQSLEVLGLTCISMLSASINAYFLVWEAEAGLKWDQDERSTLFRKSGIRGYVRMIEELLNLPVDQCPADLVLMEQVILARNATQHPDRIADLIPRHRRSDLKKYPQPFFITEFESIFLQGELADISLFIPRIRVSQEKLLHALEESETLAAWLDERLQSILARRYGE